MLNYFLNIKKLISRKGFVGPKYHGLFGKLRFIFQHLITHKEYIYCFSETRKLAQNNPAHSDFTIKHLKSFKKAEPYREYFENHYYHGFTKGWKSYFSWNEELILAFKGEQVVAFCWLQIGNCTGGTYCYPLFSNEYRILRAGVLPNKRGHNYQILMNNLLTSYLVNNRSAKRIYAEVFIDNVPSCKTFEKSNYQIIGIIRVWSLFTSSKPFIQWKAFFPGNTQSPDNSSKIENKDKAST